jgi:hypothetical protein
MAERAQTVHLGALRRGELTGGNLEARITPPAHGK